MYLTFFNLKARPKIEYLEDRTLMSAGGGFTNGGILGSYYATSALPAIGTPAAFTRNDDQLDFTLAPGQAPGGSNDPAFAQVSETNYSVRWAGQVIPQFGETYTFSLAADQGVRLSIRPTGTSTYTVLYNSLGSSSPTSASVSYKMTAGASYDIMVEYEHSGSSASSIDLQWSSPSTPLSVIQPVSSIGFNVGTAWSFDASGNYFANAIMDSRAYWETNSTVAGYGDQIATCGPDGWPTENASLVVWEGVTNTQGTYLLSFKGQASVYAGYGTFNVGSNSYGDFLPTGVGYNAATDTTTAYFTVAASEGSYDLTLKFFNTVQQTSSGPQPGVSNVSLMRPQVVGGSVPYAAGTLFTTAYLDSLQPFSVLRTMDASGTNSNSQVNWSDRTTPTSWFSQNYYANSGSTYQGPFDTNGVAWEYLVALANETGKDLYINIPAEASNAYIQDLADLIKYGSDGTNPYTSYQTSPVWAPLNPNLHVYIEYSNELWNGGSGFAQYAENLNSAVAAVTSGTPTGTILNYNNLANNSQDQFVWAMRQVALQTVDISNIFRGVFGKAAMMTTIRPVMNWDADDVDSTARIELSFIDDYFNNGTGFNFVSNPEPVSYYIWGGGGAAYYSAANEAGYQSAILFSNANFSSVPVNPSTNELISPKNAGWIFQGNTAGIVLGGTNGSPTASDSTQLAFLTPGAEMSQKIVISTPGVYGISFEAATGVVNSNLSAEVDVYLNGQLFAQEYPNGQQFIGYETSYRWSGVPGYVDITIPGTYSFLFEAPSSNNATMYLSDIALTSEAAIYNAAIPVSNGDYAADSSPPQSGNGENAANYQRALDLETNWASAYGINEVTYESGWELSSINGTTGIEYYAEYQDPASSDTTQAQLNAINDYVQAGGSLLMVGTFAQWDTLQDASTAPLVVAVEDSNQSLPVAPTNGLTLVQYQSLMLDPANVSLVPDNAVIDDSNAGYDTSAAANGLSASGNVNWMSWNTIVPNSLSNQTFTLSTGVSGAGTYQLWVDNQLIDTETINDSSGSPLTFNSVVTLGAGMHDVRIKALAGSIGLQQILISQGVVPTLPPLPTNLSTSGVTSSAITLSWSDSGTTLTGYKVEIATNPGFTQNTSTQTVSRSTRTATFSGLAADTLYYLSVAAINMNGFSNPATTSATTLAASIPPPTAPANLAATALAPNDVHLSFVNEATNETGFLLQRSLNQSTWTNVATIPAVTGAGTSVTYDDLGLNPGVTYYYRVSAVNGAGSSSYITAQAATPFPTNTILNPDFGNPQVSGQQANPGGANWVFNGLAGIAANGAIAGAANAPYGNQAGYIQGSVSTPGSISQTIQISAGDYEFSLYAAAQVVSGTAANVPIQVQLFNATTNALLRNTTITPTATFTQYLVPFYTLAAGSYTITLTTTSSGIALVDAPSLINTNVNHFDVGTPAVSGNASYNGQTYTVSGSGSIGGTADSFQYVRNTISGNAIAVAELTGISSATSLNPGAMAGVMFRSSDPNNSSFAYAFATAGGTVGFEWRTTNGGSTQQSSTVSIPTPSATNPVWLQVIRQGSTFTAAYSTNATTWITLGSSQTLNNFNAIMDTGMAVTSNDNTNLVTATLNNYETSSDVVGQDIGNPPTAGSTSYAATQNRWVVSGSGNALNTSSDSMQFASLPAASGTSITAQLGSLTGTSTSLGGIAYRDSTAANAAYVAILVGANGTLFEQSRDANGNVTTTPLVHLTGVDGAAPVWLQLSYANGTVTASYSLANDGSPTSTDWIPLSTVNITFSANVQAGLIATNGNSSASGLTTAAFRGVNIT